MRQLVITGPQNRRERTVIQAYVIRSTLGRTVGEVSELVLAVLVSRLISRHLHILVFFYSRDFGGGGVE